MTNDIAGKGITDLASSIVDDANNNNHDGNETTEVVGKRSESGNGSVEEKTKPDADKVERGASAGSTINTVFHKQGKMAKQKFGNLLNEEIGIRNSYTTKPGAQGKGGVINVVLGAVLNMVSAFLIFVLFLISLESLFTIALSISLTICKYRILETKIIYTTRITLQVHIVSMHANITLYGLLSHFLFF